MRRELIICSVLAAVILSVYWPVRQHDFICYDDPDFVTQNPNVQAGLTWQSLRYAFVANVSGQNWHPVTILSHAVDCELFGVNPGPQHLVNVGFHAANALLLFLLLQRLTGTTWRSATVAALFALHPLRVESVAWIAERKDVLSGLFFLLTLWAYAGYVQKSKVQGPESESAPRSAVPSSMFDVHSWRANAWYRFALLFFALGLMSKPMLVTLPFVLLLLDFWPLGRFQLTTINSDLSTLLRLAWEKWRFFALSAVSCWMTLWVMKRESAIETTNDVSLRDRMVNALVSYLQYLGKTFWPADLAVLYPHPARHYPVSEQWPRWEIWAAAWLLVAISALCICQLRRRPYLAVGWLWYLGTMVPVIGLVQVGEQAMADRYTYIPLIGPVISLVWLLSELVLPAHQASGAPAFLPATSASPELAGRNAGAPAVPCIGQWSLAALAVVLLGLCSVLTRHQLQYWRNSVTLFEHTVEVTPDNPIAQCNLGYGLFLEGKPALAAIRYRAALAINPLYTQAHFNLGGVLKDQERWPEAAEQYLAVTRLEPDLFLPHLALAQILPRLGRTKDAAFHLDQFLRTCPSANLESPNSPIREPALNCLNDLAWPLATGGQAESRDGGRAVRFAERACEMTQYSRAIMVSTLAAAYAEAGRFPEAVVTAEKANALAVLYDDQALLKKNPQLLELYRAGKPYHEPAATTEENLR